MTNAEAGIYFSTLKRIKTFLRSTMSQDTLAALAMLAIEKDTIANMKKLLMFLLHVKRGGWAFLQKLR